VCSPAAPRRRTAARAIRAEADAYYAIALTRACASGLSAGVWLLLQARVDPGVPATGAARFSGGEPFAITPLQAAASGASLECVELLLTAGTDGRESGTTGKPAEQVASDLGAPECAEAIRRSNASRELVGQAVLLTGLTAKGELNGRRGVALSYESKRQRLAVALTPRWSEPSLWPLWLWLWRRGPAAATAPLLLKAANLRPLGPAVDRRLWFGSYLPSLTRSQLPFAGGMRVHPLAVALVALLVALAVGAAANLAVAVWRFDAAPLYG